MWSAASSVSNGPRNPAVAKLPVPTVLELPNGIIRSGPGTGEEPDAAEGEARGATTLPLNTGLDIVQASATTAVAAASKPRRAHRGRSCIAHPPYRPSRLLCGGHYHHTIRTRRATTTGRSGPPIEELMTG